MKEKYLLMIACLVTSVGCGQRAAPVYPVSGSLLVNGRPATGATLFFHPQADRVSEKRMPFAIVKEDGTFQATTNGPNDGAPEGVYAVTVVWPVRGVSEGEMIEGPDQLQGRFASSANPAANVTVLSGPNEIPAIDLRFP